MRTASRAGRDGSVPRAASGEARRGASLFRGHFVPSSPPRAACRGGDLVTPPSSPRRRFRVCGGGARGRAQQPPSFLARRLSAAPTTPCHGARQGSVRQPLLLNLVLICSCCP